MSITWGWYNQSARIVLNQFTGEWTWQEYFDSEPEAIKLCSSIDGRFDVLVDLTDASYTIPANTLTHWMNAAQRANSLLPNWGLSVIVSPNQLPHLFFKTVKWVSPFVREHYRITLTIEEALNTIYAERAIANAHIE